MFCGNSLRNSFKLNSKIPHDKINFKTNNLRECLRIENVSSLKSQSSKNTKLEEITQRRKEGKKNCDANVLDGECKNQHVQCIGKFTFSDLCCMRILPQNCFEI